MAYERQKKTWTGLWLGGYEGWATDCYCVPSEDFKGPHISNASAAGYNTGVLSQSMRVCVMHCHGFVLLQFLNRSVMNGIREREKKREHERERGKKCSNKRKVRFSNLSFVKGKGRGGQEFILITKAACNTKIQNGVFQV